MRSLSPNDLGTVSGAGYFYVPEFYGVDAGNFAMYHEGASREAAVDAVLVGGLAACVGIGLLGASPAVVMWSSLALGSLAYNASYQSYELWPWNY